MACAPDTHRPPLLRSGAAGSDACSRHVVLVQLCVPNLEEDVGDDGCDFDVGDAHDVL